MNSIFTDLNNHNFRIGADFMGDLYTHSLCDGRDYAKLERLGKKYDEHPATNLAKSLMEVGVLVG